MSRQVGILVLVVVVVVTKTKKVENCLQIPGKSAHSCRHTVNHFYQDIIELGTGAQKRGQTGRQNNRRIIKTDGKKKIRIIKNILKFYFRKQSQDKQESRERRLMMSHLYKMI